MDALLHHLHPALSGAPVWLIALALLFDSVAALRGRREPSGLATSGLILFLVATLLVGAAFFSGYLASERANGFFLVPDEVIGDHHRSGRLLLMLMVLAAGIRWILHIAERGRGVLGVLYGMLGATCLLLAAVTAFKGGELVFSHGAGVRAGVLASPQEKRGN